MRTPAPALPRALFVFLLAGVLVTGCARKDPVASTKVPAFDTMVNITLIGVDRAKATRITSILAADLAQMEQEWHAWREGGPVSHVNQRFNEDGGDFIAPPSVLSLVQLSKSLSDLSGGLFNPAIGHLLRAWGFQDRPADCLKPPPQELIDQVVKAAPSMADVQVDGIRLRSDNHLVKLDFRAIQTGFVIDQAIARLQEMGIHNASITIDGNVRAIGSRDGHPWSVPLRGPDGGGIIATVQIKGNEAAFTASFYRNSFTWEGRNYHDIIDPRSGYPASDTASVTVLHSNATTADAAATALFIAGPRDWHRVAKDMGVRYVMLTDKQGRLHMNPAMQARLRMQRGNREVIVSEPLT
jgi:thiamine biosynthesis lipoprotein